MPKYDLCLVVLFDHGRFRADLHFNRLRESLTLKRTQDFNEFLSVIRAGLADARNPAKPFPGKSSAMVAGWQQKTLSVVEDLDKLLPDGHMGQVNALVEEIRKEWEEFSKIDVSLTPEEEQNLGN